MMKVNRRNHGRKRMGQSYLGIRTRLDFMIALRALLKYLPMLLPVSLGGREGCGQLSEAEREVVS